MNTGVVVTIRRSGYVVVALAGLLAACSSESLSPKMASVCDLPNNVERSVQVAATVSVDAEGKAHISDAACPSTRIALELSAAGSRSGAAEKLKSAAQEATSGGKSSFQVSLSGVYKTSMPQPTFVADEVSSPPAP
jgi:hypothetical protein